MKKERKKSSPFQRQLLRTSDHVAFPHFLQLDSINALITHKTISLILDAQICLKI